MQCIVNQKWTVYVCKYSLCRQSCANLSDFVHPNFVVGLFKQATGVLLKTLCLLWRHRLYSICFLSWYKFQCSSNTFIKVRHHQGNMRTGKDCVHWHLGWFPRKYIERDCSKSITQLRWDVVIFLSCCAWYPYTVTVFVYYLVMKAVAGFCKNNIMYVCVWQS